MQVSEHMGHGMAMKSMRPMGDGGGPPGRAVGHQARAAIHAAIENGIDVPKNAMGLAASAIARGMDPADIFAALVEPEPPVDDPAPVEEPFVVDDPAPVDGDLGTAPTDEAPPPDEAPLPDDTAPPPEETAPPPDDGPSGAGATALALSGFTAALDLLQPATSDEIALALLDAAA